MTLVELEMTGTGGVCIGGTWQPYQEAPIGALKFGGGFRMSPEDPRRGRSIIHEYDPALIENPLT
jgi:hypothetical protein